MDLHWGAQTMRKFCFSPVGDKSRGSVIASLFTISK